MFRVSNRAVVRSISILSGAFGTSTKMEAKPMTVRSYTPSNSEGEFPYSVRDLTPMDASPDAVFYAPPRFVTHIDDNAIKSLKKYYGENLPRRGRILDFCSSWVSHYPPEIEQAAKSDELEVLGTGMNEQELSRNPVLKAWVVQNLNETPEVRIPGNSDQPVDASTCVVSIDYLTKPVEVLKSIRGQTCSKGKIHLAISNRCFPTKAVSRWLNVTEDQRLAMVGDYLWWSGWRDIEIVTVVEGTWMRDPLWVVRASNPNPD